MEKPVWKSADGDEVIMRSSDGPLFYSGGARHGEKVGRVPDGFRVVYPVTSGSFDEPAVGQVWVWRGTTTREFGSMSLIVAHDPTEDRPWKFLRLDGAPGLLKEEYDRDVQIYYKRVL